MKNYLSRVLCLLLCLALVLSISACSNAKTSSFTLDDDEEWDIDDTSDIEIADDGTGASNTGTTSKNNSSKKGTKTSSKSGTGTAAPTVSNADDMTLEQLAASIPAALKGTTFTVLSWNPVTDVTDADKVVKRFEKDTGIKVKWNQHIYDTYQNKIAALENAGKSPDLIRYIVPTPSRMYLCQALETATGYDFKGNIWDKRVMDAYSYKGKHYAANLRNTFNQQPSAVFYKPSMIDRYKLEDPYVLWKNGKWTYDKLKEMCRAFKADTGREGWMTSSMIDYLWYNDVDLVAFDGKHYSNNLKSPAVITALQEVIANYGDISPSAMRMNDRFEDGTHLFYSDNILALRRTDFHFTELKANKDVECVPFPTQPGKTYYTNFQEMEAFGVPKGSKNGAAAYYFLRWYANADCYDAKTFFNSEQILEVYRFLMSQEHYNYNTDRRITGDAGNDNAGIDHMIRIGELTADQIVTQLDSLEGFMEKACKSANEILDKFE